MARRRDVIETYCPLPESEDSNYTYKLKMGHSLYECKDPASLLRRAMHNMGDVVVGGFELWRSCVDVEREY